MLAGIGGAASERWGYEIFVDVCGSLEDGRHSTIRKQSHGPTPARAPCRHTGIIRLHDRALRGRQ